MHSLRYRLSLSLAAVLIGAGVLLGLALQSFPRGLVQDYVLSRLRHDADRLFVRALESPPDAASLEAAWPSGKSA